VGGLAGCAVNPVTGETELALVSTAQEVQIGEQQYGPGRQMFGGDYVADPELTRYVAGVGARLAAVSDRELPYEFTVINDSTPNAWALPGGKIAVHRGLLTEIGSEAELAAVLGHEIVHAAARHGAQAMQRGMLLQGAYVAAAVTANQSDYGPLLMTATGLGLQLINQRYGRDAERESDRYGMLYMSRAGYDPSAAVDLQETFLRLAEKREPSWLEGLFASHPPSAERVANNRATLVDLEPGGELGEGRYRAATRRLMATREAYAAHDRGRKALAAGDAATALAAAETALAREPGEAQFHALRGDVRSAQGRWGDALVNYKRAVDRNPGYFYPTMRRGLAHRELRKTEAAIADLERSIELLPTAPAMNALGEIKLAAGEQARAAELFRAASRSDSPDGRAASRSLMRLELPEKPYLYVKSVIGQDAAGRLAVELRNATDVDIRVQELSFQYRDANGQVRTVSRNLKATVQAGSAARLRIDPRKVGGVTDPRNLRAAVTRARILE
jgi:predicted Zn-dependent protease